MPGPNSQNRGNQCNPTHTKSGPGHQAGYHGSGTRADTNNHANQMNPNNSNYQGQGARK